MIINGIMLITMIYMFISTVAYNPPRDVEDKGVPCGRCEKGCSTCNWTGWINFKVIK